MSFIPVTGFFFKGINLVPLCITYCENSFILLIFLTPTDYYTFRYCHCQEFSNSILYEEFLFPFDHLIDPLNVLADVFYIFASFNPAFHDFRLV